MRPIYVLLYLLCALALPAQESTLHADRPFYAAGEVMRYQVYLPESAPGTVRAEVYGPDGVLVDYYFLRTRGDAAEGYHRWDYDLPTGYYRLRFSGLTAGNRPVDLGTFRYAVYNVSDRKQAPAAAPASPPPAPPEGGLTVEVRAGEIIATGLPAGPYSVAIVNTEVTGPGVAVQTAAATVAYAYADTLFYGGVLTGAQSGEPYAVNLLPFFDTRTLDTYFSKSDAAGRYVLTVPAFEGEKQVQARGVNDARVRARLTFPEIEAITDAPPVTAAVLNYLDLSNRRRKIYQLYGGVETPLDAVPAAATAKPLEPNESYNVQDYKTFPDMLTFFNEVAGELRYRRRRGELSAALYNAPNQRFFSDTPLFIVDGRLTRDAEYVAGLSPADVSRLEYFYDNRQLRRDFPALGSQGVVRIELLRDNGKFPAADGENLLTIRGLRPAQPFGREDGIPRLSPLLHWAAGRTEGGELRLAVPATDDPGEYRVIVVARDAAGGSVRSGSTTVAVAASR